MSKSKALVYSTEVCPFCVRAKKLLKLKEIEYSEIKVRQDISKPEFQAEILSQTGKEVNTVPQIFVNNKYIGGFNDLVAHFEEIISKELENTLQEIVV